MKKYFLTILPFLCYSIFVYGQINKNKIDTINAKKGTIIITRIKDNSENLKNKFRSLVDVVIKDKESHSARPLSFIGINKVRYQTSEKGTARLFLQKGHYKISANTVGYETVSAVIKIDLQYNYNIEVLLLSQSKPLY